MGWLNWFCVMDLIIVNYQIICRNTRNLGVWLINGWWRNWMKN
jgi:hypothetical protein